MTARTVPPDWRPVISRDGGRYRLAFRGRDITSVVDEFTDVGVMLGRAAGTGVDRLLLSPWVSLVPAEADTATALAVCDVHNAALAALAAADREHISAVGAVVLQDPALAARQTAGRCWPAGTTCANGSASPASSCTATPRREPWRSTRSAPPSRCTRSRPRSPTSPPPWSTRGRRPGGRRAYGLGGSRAGAGRRGHHLCRV